MEIHEKIANALVDLKELLIQGHGPEDSVPKLAAEHQISEEVLRVRAQTMIDDPAIRKYRDPAFREEQAKIERERHAVGAAKLASRSGSERDFDTVLFDALGPDFTDEEKQKILIQEIIKDALKS